MKVGLFLVTAFLLWPGCSSENACEEPDEIDFGEIVSAEKAKYLENDRVQYRCNPVYVLEGPEWIQCKGQEWTPRPPKCLAPCSITRQQLAAKNLFVFGKQRKAQLIQSNHSLQFQCSEGYVLVVPSVRKCVDGYMDLPLCISEKGKNCSGPPRIENGDITTLSEKQYRSGSSVEFICQKYYTMEGQKRSFCDNGTWTKVPICLDPCMIPKTDLESQKIEVKDEIDAPESIFVQHGHFIELTCTTGYVLAANSSQSAFVIHCDGKPPEIPKCKEITCNSPRISNGTFRPQRAIYHDGDLIRIQCDNGFTFEPDNGGKVVECTNNGWSPSPKCVNTEGGCGRPPAVDNGDIVETLKETYVQSESVTYQCHNGYILKGSARVTCQNGHWSKAPTCAGKGCDYVHIENGGMSDYLERYKPFPIREGQSIQFYCNRGFLPANKQTWHRATCINSRYDPEPKCFKKCDPSVRFIHGRFIYNYSTYIEGDVLTFVCETGYSPENQQSTSTCTKKGWSPVPRCIPPVACTASEDDMREHNIKLKWVSGEKIYSPDGSTVEFVCLRGYKPHPDTGSFRVSCVDGKFDYPDCIPI